MSNDSSSFDELTSQEINQVSGGGELVEAAKFFTDMIKLPVYLGSALAGWYSGAGNLNNFPWQEFYPSNPNTTVPHE